MMKHLVFAAALAVGVCGVTHAQDAQMGSMKMNNNAKAPKSPHLMAMTDLGGTQIHVSYGAPSLRGRKMVGEKDPYGKEWAGGRG